MFGRQLKLLYYSKKRNLFPYFKIKFVLRGIWISMLQKMTPIKLQLTWIYIVVFKLKWFLFSVSVLAYKGRFKVIYNFCVTTILIYISHSNNTRLGYDHFKLKFSLACMPYFLDIYKGFKVFENRMPGAY